MDQIPQSFINKVDNLVISCDKDPELQEGFQYINDKAILTGKTTYEIIMEMLYDDYIKTRTKEWINNKQSL